VAKNIVKAGLADTCEVQLSYAIGVVEPTSVHVDTFGTAKIEEEQIDKLIRDHFDLTPRGIIDTLGLRKPVFRETAYHGHFGNSNFAWEKTDVAAKLKKAAKIK